MPWFRGYPPPPHDYPYYWSVHIGSQIKTIQSQSYKFNEFAEIWNQILNLKKITRDTPSEAAWQDV